MHLAGRDFPMPQQPCRSPAGGRCALDAARADGRSRALPDLIADEVGYLEEHWPQELEIGTIHADLFPDNVFFLGDKLSGLIDF